MVYLSLGDFTTFYFFSLFYFYYCMSSVYICVWVFWGRSLWKKTLLCLLLDCIHSFHFKNLFDSVINITVLGCTCFLVSYDYAYSCWNLTSVLFICLCVLFMFSWFWFSFYLFFLGKNLEKIPSVFVFICLFLVVRGVCGVCVCVCVCVFMGIYIFTYIQFTELYWLHY